ncbi:hypothetical protein D7V88_10300 [Corallococcus terminator]|uniref:Uncharacterized protein n=2 Tax=Corallococcus terminator TaxID=2316733 RepID=A0A3A8J5Z5_9BACT|nr:hypothetical protein D7V88_10300 [Corallococcus terminator]
MLGHVFGMYQSLEDRSNEQLAVDLACSPETLNLLALCIRPEGEAFLDQVKDICRRFEVKPSALVTVLRRVEVMEALEEDSSNESGMRTLQIAARDRSRNREPKP